MKAKQTTEGAGANSACRGRLCTVALLLVLICAVLLGIGEYKDARLKARSILSESAIQGIMADISGLADRGSLDVAIFGEMPSGDWLILNSDTYDKLIDELIVYGSLEAQGPHGVEPLIDPYGERYMMAVRESNGPIEIGMWSKGPDRISGTADDIRATGLAGRKGELLGIENREGRALRSED